MLEKSPAVSNTTVTLQELHVEVFYPADAETEAMLQAYEEHAKAVFGEAQSAR